MGKIFVSWKWILIPLYLLISAFILGLLTAYMHTDKSVLYLTPTFEDAKGWDIYTLTDGTRTELTPRELLHVKPGETFYLSYTLTEDWDGSGYTFLLLDSDRPSSVFLNKELLYSTCSSTGQRIGQIAFPKSFKGLSERGEAIRCTLPKDSAGKVITIATTHPASEYGPSMPGIRLSGEAIEAESWMNTANYNSMPAAGFSVAALLLLGLLFYSLFHSSRNWSLLLLAAAALCYLFYHLRQYSFYSPGLTPLDTPLAAFLPIPAILLPELYLLLQMKRWKKPCMILVLSSAAPTLVPPVANLFGTPSFRTTPFVEAIYIGLLALLVFAALEARGKNKVFQLFLFGLAGSFTCIIIGCFVSMMGNHFFAAYVSSLLNQVAEHDPMLFLYWYGIFLFTMAAAISVYQLICSTANTQTELAVQTERLARLDYELAIQKEIYETKLSGEDELRALRHDIRGHLSTLSKLLADSKTEEASLYLSELTKHHQERQSEVFCSNPYVNAVLGAYSPQLKENKITFSCHVGVDSQTLPGVEVCLILNNALENALEASLRMLETDRYVKVQARIWHGQFLLRVSNRFDGTLHERSGLPVSTKKGKGHGYGMANIRSTVQRLGGEMSYQIEEGCFVLDIHFPAQGEQDNQDTL